MRSSRDGGRLVAFDATIATGAVKGAKPKHLVALQAVLRFAAGLRALGFGGERRSAVPETVAFC